MPSESLRTSETQGSSARNVGVLSQLPSAFRGIPPPPPLSTIPPPPPPIPTIPPPPIPARSLPPPIHSPPIHSFSTSPPSFRNYALQPGFLDRISASALVPSVYGSTPVPTPAGGNSTGTAFAPVASQAPGYPPLTNQQPFRSSAQSSRPTTYSSASRYSDPMTYQSQGLHSLSQYPSSTTYPQQTLLHMAPGTPPETSGPKTPGRRTDTYVAHDPFRPSTSSSAQAVENLLAISNHTTFDDIPTADSSSTRPSSASIPLGSNGYEPSNHFLSGPHPSSLPTSASQTQNIAHSQYSTPSLQPTGSYQQHSLSGPHPSSLPTSAPQTQNIAHSQYATPSLQPTGSDQQHYSNTQPDPLSAAQQTAPLPTQRPLPSLPGLPGQNYGSPAFSPPSGGYLPLQPLQPLRPFTQIHYPNLPEPDGSPLHGHSVSYYTPYKPLSNTGLESNERSGSPTVPPQWEPFAWQNPSDTKDDFIPGYVNTPSVWLRIGRFIRLPYDLIRGSKPLGFQARPFADYADQIEEKTEGYGKAANRIIFATLPRTFYWYLLLRLPSLYFGRVARIFEEADLSLPEIKEMALETAVQGQCVFQAMERSTLPPRYEQLKVTWQSFIDDVMREWQTFNIISVLLLS